MWANDFGSGAREECGMEKQQFGQTDRLGEQFGFELELEIGLIGEGFDG